MNKKKAISISVIIVFVVYITTSLFLISKKPDISKISKAQQIAEYTKPAVVRIVSGVLIQWKYTPDYDSYFYYLDSAIMEYLKNNGYKTTDLGAGSGSIISPNGYIVTNAHVVEIAKLENAQIIKIEIAEMSVEIASFINSKYGVNLKPESLVGYLEGHLKVDQPIQKVIKVFLPGGGDLMDGEIKSYGAPVGEGKDVAVIKIEKTNLPSVILGDSEKVQLQENIWVFGYPGAADSQTLSKESILVVSITDGKVSATDKKSTQGAPVLQINAAATHGNSGGPVIDEDGNIVGLLTFRSENNPKETQGFNFVVPVNTVKEFVSQAGAKNEEGDVNKLYKQGLQLYWGGYYKDALASFEATQRLYPNHSELKKLIADCQQKSPQSKILWSKYKNIAIGTDVLALICIIALVYFGFIKDKKGKNNNQEDIKEINETTDNKSLKEQPDFQNNTKNNVISLEETKTLNKNIKSRLYAISGPLEGKVIELDSEPITIGRDPRICKLIFSQDCIEIARKHCTISYNSEGKVFELEDNGSENGTFLGNGERINSQEKKYLKSGDSFYLSSSEYLFEVWLE
jgi:serine protease Do